MVLRSRVLSCFKLHKTHVINLKVHASQGGNRQEHMGWSLCTYNCWEPLQTELLQYTDAASHAFVDIGSNIG